MSLFQLHRSAIGNDFGGTLHHCRRSKPDVDNGIIDIIAAEPSQGEYALDLLMIAKYFERICDHCTNIAEWVEFSVTGIHKDCQ